MGRNKIFYHPDKLKSCLFWDKKSKPPLGKSTVESDPINFLLPKSHLGKLELVGIDTFLQDEYKDTPLMMQLNHYKGSLGAKPQILKSPSVGSQNKIAFMALMD